MIYIKRKPKYPLQSFIECYYYWENHQLLSQNLFIDSPPSGYPALVFNFGDDYLVRNQKYPNFKAPRAFITGQSLHRYQLRLLGNIRMLGVVFKPAGLSSLLDLPLIELTNERVALDAILPPREAGIWCERLYDQKDPQGMFDLLDIFFLNKMNANCPLPGPIDYAANLIVGQFGVFKIDDILKKVFMSRRKFERSFLQRVGISPKYYGKIRRIGHLCSLMAGEQEMEWQRLIAMGEYYDQAHFIKEFKEFMEVSPSVYLSSNKELIHFLEED